MKVCEAENRKKIQLTFCSAARITAGLRVLPVLLRGLPRVKDLICMSAALRNKFHHAPHLACFGLQCHCRGSLTAVTIFFCYKKNHARGCIRDTKLIKSCPCLDERCSCGAKSSLHLAHLAFGVLKGSPRIQPIPSNGMGQGHTAGVCLEWGRDTEVNFVWCQAGTHRQVLSGMLGQAGVLRLRFPTLFRGKPRPGQPQTRPPGARALLVRREASTSRAYAHPSSRPALPNGAPHLPS